MKEITLKVFNATILESFGADTIFFDIGGKITAPFPGTEDTPHIEIRVRKGYAKEWLKENFELRRGFLRSYLTR